jgi:hypothetical protein
VPDLLIIVFSNIFLETYLTAVSLYSESFFNYIFSESKQILSSLCLETCVSFTTVLHFLGIQNRP